MWSNAFRPRLLPASPGGVVGRRRRLGQTGAMTERPEDMPEGGFAPETDTTESDPSGDAIHEGGMGLSSERTDEAGHAYGGRDTRETDEVARDEDGDPLPEQSADPATGEPEQGSPDGPNPPPTPSKYLGRS